MALDKIGPRLPRRHENQKKKTTEWKERNQFIRESTFAIRRRISA